MGDTAKVHQDAQGPPPRNEPLLRSGLVTKVAWLSPLCFLRLGEWFFSVILLSVRSPS